MNDILRDRLLRKLDLLPDDKLNQVLDYIEFLDSKYAPRNAPAPNPLTRFAEGVESTLRAGKVSASAISGTMSIMNKAVGAITDVANAGKSVATGIMGAATSTTSETAQPPAVPDIPRGGPHELGSKLPPTSGEDRK